MIATARPNLEVGPRLSLIDIAAEQQASVQGRLDRVGMGEIELPLRLSTPQGLVTGVPGRVDAFVDLDDPSAKGIHMSRLFLLAQEVLEKEVLQFGVLETMLRGFLESHRDISTSAYVDVRFELMLRRPALKSGFEGWRSYPVTMRGALEDGRFRGELEVRVTYSSTCPCSAALARQHIRDRFLETFGETGAVDPAAVAVWLESPEGVSATPHSQRSHADVRVRIDPERPIGVAHLIDRLEGCLETPVQAAVKRVDEQAFAVRNGENPMFCEDAARRLDALLRATPALLGHEIGIEHQESLHAHNAVSHVSYWPDEDDASS